MFIKLTDIRINTAMLIAYQPGVTSAQPPRPAISFKFTNGQATVVPYVSPAERDEALQILDVQLAAK